MYNNFSIIPQNLTTEFIFHGVDARDLLNRKEKKFVCNARSFLKNGVCSKKNRIRDSLCRKFSM